MNPLQQFLAITASYDSGDAWPDCGADEAGAALGAFQSHHWHQLSTTLSSLPNEQLQRIAYALADGIPDESCPLLIQLIESKDTDTALAACDSLRAILETFHKTMPVSPHVVNFIHDLANMANEPWKSSCESLLKHLVTLRTNPNHEFK